MDFWINPVNTTGEKVLFARSVDNVLTAGDYYVGYSNGSIRFGGGNNTEWNTGLTYPAGSWHHLAFVWNGVDTQYAFVDGVGVSSGATSFISASGGPFQIGHSYNVSNLYGSIDEFRVSKGIARWTANFTPPARPYRYGSNVKADNETIVKAEGAGSTKITLGAPQIDGNTVALWHLEETGTTTGTTLYDATANAKNGTTTGTPNVVDGIFGKARYFDGVDDYVNIGSSVTSAVDNFTLSAWFKRPSAPAPSAMIIQNGNNSGGYGIGIGSDGAPLGIYNSIVWQSFSTNGLTGASGLYNLVSPVDTWTHIALVRNNGTTVGYMNGVQYPVYYPTTAPAAVANAAAIGKGATTAGGAAGDVYFKGTIDEPMALNRALSPTKSPKPTAWALITGSAGL